MLAALFGRSCRGGTALSLVKDAIAARLASLGVDATELVDALCIRMPPTFPMR